MTRWFTDDFDVLVDYKSLVQVLVKHEKISFIFSNNNVVIRSCASSCEYWANSDNFDQKFRQAAIVLNPVRDNKPAQAWTAGIWDWPIQDNGEPLRKLNWPATWQECDVLLFYSSNFKFQGQRCQKLLLLLFFRVQTNNALSTIIISRMIVRIDHYHHHTHDSYSYYSDTTVVCYASVVHHDQGKQRGGTKMTPITTIVTVTVCLSVCL